MSESESDIDKTFNIDRLREVARSCADQRVARLKAESVERLIYQAENVAAEGKRAFLLRLDDFSGGEPEVFDYLVREARNLGFTVDYRTIPGDLRISF